MEDTAGYLRRAFVRWEALRPVYNLVVFGGIGGVLLHMAHLDKGTLIAVLLHMVHPDTGTLIAGLFVFIVINAVYCLGPLTESALFVFANVRMGRARYALWALMTAVPVCKFEWLWSLLTFFMGTIYKG